MDTTSGDAGVAAVLLLGLLAEWLLIYTAVRIAVGHANDRRRPVLEAEATAAPDNVRLAVVNAGTGAAFDLAMGWADDPSSYPLARTPLLPIGGRLECNLAAAAVADETMYVRFLKVEWRESPDLALSNARRAVLIPSRLSPRK